LVEDISSFREEDFDISDESNSTQMGNKVPPQKGAKRRHFCADQIEVDNDACGFDTAPGDRGA
jgi:hypothetical protein